MYPCHLTSPGMTLDDISKKFFPLTLFQTFLASTCNNSVFWSDSEDSQCFLIVWTTNSVKYETPISMHFRAKVLDRAYPSNSVKHFDIHFLSELSFAMGPLNIHCLFF
eukprot:TRINITY_DN9905_c0_g1_i2.p1 TRINITY_DN9905_c0_g1~~TRINITY_DN9905_c0_g1_i2.p1  ORF type:complete len:108 (-),score=0.39 TRINITY_DN9905_c0_g1_i2:343-666(-)